MNDLHELLRHARELEVSDVHLKVGRKPILRIQKQLTEYGEWDQPLTDDQIHEFTTILIPPAFLSKLKTDHELDFAFESPDTGRFRVNAFFQRGHIGMVLRRIKEQVASFADLSLPPVLETISQTHDGLILVTGPTGCGKSTTLSAIINYINEHEVRHIVTIEDPIEFLYTDRQSVINQREVGLDTDSFEAALRHVLRQNPDVIMIGELRDAKSFEAAVAASETGHLVLATLHTNDTITTIRRLLDFFPTSQHDQVRKVLAYHLKATVCQKIVPRKSKDGMVPVCEIMLVTPMISKLIQDDRLSKIAAAMGSDKVSGSQSFNRHLVQLIQSETIEKEAGFTVSPSPDMLEMNLRGIYLDEDSAIIGD